MPVTAAYEAGYERVFGKREPVRGKWIQDQKTGALIPADQYVPRGTVERVPVMTDRYMEGVCAPDAEKTDIGSRAKRREYMHKNGLVDADDFKGQWEKAEKIRKEGDPESKKRRREVIGRIAYEMEMGRYGKRRRE